MPKFYREASKSRYLSINDCWELVVGRSWGCSFPCILAPCTEEEEAQTQRDGEAGTETVWPKDTGDAPTACAVCVIDM